MSKAVTPISPPTQAEPSSSGWPLLPTETEIYILPDGRVVVADLPVELETLIAELGIIAPALLPTDEPGADVQ